ncbi:hypothetical protein LV779_38595 [Streptomyces thinghirensis]|nr:hypothetical protein [Streptomyces thinghirensis]
MSTGGRPATAARRGGPGRAYRIVQSRVQRHPSRPRHRVDVRTEQGPRTSRSRSPDNGRGPAPVGAGSGSGIAGMRERAWAATPGGSRPRSPNGCRG